MGPLRQSPKRAHRSTAARANSREFVKAVQRASRAGRHARGELGVGMGALHLSFQGCHQPWGEAELATFERMVCENADFPARVAVAFQAAADELVFIAAVSPPCMLPARV